MPSFFFLNARRRALRALASSARDDMALLRLLLGFGKSKMAIIMSRPRLHVIRCNQKIRHVPPAFWVQSPSVYSMLISWRPGWEKSCACPASSQGHPLLWPMIPGFHWQNANLAGHAYLHNLLAPNWTCPNIPPNLYGSYPSFTLARKIWLTRDGASNFSIIAHIGKHYPHLLDFRLILLSRSWKVYIGW